MTVDNPSFETQAAAPGGPGRPADWTVNTAGAAREWAQFAVTGSSEGEARETFELGWPVYADQFVEALVLGDDPNIELAIFEVGPDERKYEDFESGWATEQWLPAMPGATAAVFDGNLVDTFAWPPITYAYENSDLEFIDFSGVGGADDFEQGWRNDSGEWFDGGVAPDWTSEYAEFVKLDGVPVPVEAFETLNAFYRITDVNFTDDRLVVSGHPFTPNTPVEIYPEDESSRAPTPLSHAVQYFAVDVVTDEFGMGIGLYGNNIPLTGVGNGVNYVTKSRNYSWVSVIEI